MLIQVLRNQPAHEIPVTASEPSIVCIQRPDIGHLFQTLDQSLLH